MTRTTGRIGKRSDRVRLLPRSGFRWSALALLLPLAEPALAQSRPMGAEPARPDLRETLGECPADLLREAWAEMHPLQMEAVNSEVLTICTEWAEDISRVLEAQARVDRAKASLRGVDTSRQGQPAAPRRDEARIAALSNEVRDLKSRIQRLETGPEQPEDAATLARLHDELARKEDELARATRAPDVTLPDPAAQPGQPAVQPATPGSDPVLDVTILPDPETPGESVAANEADTGTSPVEPVLRPLPQDAMAEPGTDLRPDVIEEPAPAAEASPAGLPGTGSTTGATAAIATTHATPAPRPIVWRVIYAARAGDGPWQVRLVGETEIAVTLPALTKDAPPRVEWRPVTEGPFTLRPGETLPDGTRLLGVSENGVELSEASATGRIISRTLAFETTRDTAPGRMAFEYRTIDPGKAGEAGQ